MHSIFHLKYRYYTVYSICEEIKGAFMTFQEEADQIYPGWKEKLAPEERPRWRLMNRRRDGGKLPSRNVEKQKPPSHFSLPPGDFCRRAWQWEAASDSDSEAA